MKVAVLGANGQIGKMTVAALVAKKASVVAVTRSPYKGKPLQGVQYRTADATDTAALMAAFANCDVVVCALGLPYSSTVWQAQWPPLVASVIAAAKACNAALLLLDNVYPYGLVHGEMTEQTPLNPCSKKGAARAEATHLLLEAAHKGVRMAIARSADFIGPGAPRSIVGAGLFKQALADAGGGIRHVRWLGDPRKLHTYNFSPDIAAALALLATTRQDIWGQTWHLPVLEPVTGIKLCELIGKEVGARVVPRPVHGWQLRLAALFGNGMAREQLEMQYQVEEDYLLSDRKFMHAFPAFRKTSLPEAVAQTIQFFA